MAAFQPLSVPHFDAAHYNAVPHFDAQVHSVSPERLLGVGRILIKYGVERELRAFLLHRHQDLLSKMIMVQSYPSSSTNLCLMEPLQEGSGRTDLTPASFHFPEGRDMEPFDFIRDNFPLSLDSNCWQEIGAYIKTHSLNDIIGVARVLGPPGHWVEHLLQNGCGTVAHTVCPEDETSWDTTGIATEWAFHEESGVVGYKVTRKCDPPPEGGGHVRTKVGDATCWLNASQIHFDLMDAEATS